MADATTTGPVLLRSGVLGHVPHAFTTRIGGVSAGPFSTLNFGNPGDVVGDSRDPLANIRRNWDRVFEAIGAEGRELVEVHQVHGAAVRVVRRGGPSHDGPHDTRADAVVTDDPARVVAVRVADCAPVLLASADGAVVAAVHAGWRGVVAGVVGAAVAAMRVLAPRSGAAGLTAAIGPCISARSFEVGPEVGEEFRRVFGAATPHVRPGPGDRLMVDLQGAIAEQLSALGVRHIEALPHCTYAEPARFFSHRRATHQRAVTGRLAAVIGPLAGR